MGTRFIPTNAESVNTELRKVFRLKLEPALGCLEKIRPFSAQLRVLRVSAFRWPTAESPLRSAG